MKKHARKISVNTESSSVLYMFIKKEENLRLLFTRWGPKFILGARFFSVPNGHVSSPNFWARGANFWRPIFYHIRTFAPDTMLVKVRELFLYVK